MADRRNMVEELKQWLKRFLHCKDAINKLIVKLEEREDSIFVEYTTKKHLYIIHPNFEDQQHLLMQLSGKDYPITLVALNTKKNLEQLINWWDILSQYPQLSIYFVHLKTSEKWAIFPFTHSRITEKQHLSVGLNALAAGVGFFQD